eukprot:scaffold22804_cov74-Phaeocystis_antarctica.AAC.14
MPHSLGCAVTVRHRRPASIQPAGSLGRTPQQREGKQEEAAAAENTPSVSDVAPPHCAVEAAATEAVRGTSTTRNVQTCAARSCAASR